MPLFLLRLAACVNRPLVVDIGKDLSFTGQVVTLLLFQIGGLGIIQLLRRLFGLRGGESPSRTGDRQSTFLHTPRRDFLGIAKRVY